MIQLLSPTGKRIIGTSDTVPAMAFVSGFDEKTMEPEYAGGSQVDWDSQRTKTRDGKALVFDEDMQEWSIAECTVEVLEPTAEEDEE